MPDNFDETGLTTKTLTEIIEELEDDYKDIYGNDINIDQNSADGQIINIQAQEGVDLRELLSSINNGFDPDQAEGRVLDQRVALNNITRNAGTFTLVPVEITVDQALNLIGLDDQSDELVPTVSNLYTVKDDAGNEFYLLASVSIVGAGTDSYSFRAANIGAVEVLVNTITTPVTIIAGVTNINNTAGASSQGVDEETDAALKVRRRASTSISAVGYLDAIEAALQDLDNVVTAIVLENNTDVTDGDGIPPHSIWAIIEGGDNIEIGTVIYAKKSSGSGMKGAVEVEITRPNGTLFTSKFDRPIDEDLYIRFNLVLPGGVVDTDNLKELIVENITWGVGADAVGSIITTYVQSLNVNYQISAMEVSNDGASWFEVEQTTLPVNRFVNDITRITIS